jgi:hypothetical protein
MSLASAAKSLLRKPEFVVVGSLLLVSAIGLNGATQMMKLHFKKLPVDLRHPISELPKTLGNWTQVSLDNPLSHDMEEVLQTKTYIFRDFVDTRLVSKSQLAQFEGKDWQERSNLVGRIQQENREAVIRLSLTYYTGMVDTVSHIPDRCFVADGYQTTDYDTPKWRIPGVPVDEAGWRLDGAGHRVNVPGDAKVGADAGLPVRFINFEDQDNRVARAKQNVTYFFQVNGRYESSPIGVRTDLQNLFEKHGYYAKIELMTSISDRGRSAAVMQDFLKDALPEIERLLPDWAAVARTGSGAAQGAVPASASVPVSAPATGGASATGGARATVPAEGK